MRDRKLNRRLAMKIIHARILNRSASAVRFIEEAQVCAQLQHPNIVRFREVYKTKKGKLCIVMDYADGGDLQGRIKDEYKQKEKTGG